MAAMPMAIITHFIFIFSSNATTNGRRYAVPFSGLFAPSCLSQVAKVSTVDYPP